MYNARIAWRAIVLALIGTAGACSHDAVGPESPVATVTVNPSAPVVAMGTEFPLTATLQDSHGTVVTGPVVHWTSSDTTIATVSDAGIVTGVALGSAQIVASADGTPGLASVTVAPVPVASVVIVPGKASSTVGSTLDLEAVTYDAAHHVLTGRAVIWSSGNQDVATVDDAGHVKAIATGAATITATSEGKSGTAAVSVSKPAPVIKPVHSVDVDPSSSTIRIGQTVQLHAIVKDADGKTLTDRPLAWTTSNAGTATVSSTGLVRAIDDGTVTITATSEGKSGSAKVKIDHRHVQHLTVGLDKSSLEVGQTAHATATLFDSEGNILTDPAVEWASNNGTIATISAAGVVQAVTVGSATIVATSDGKSGTASVTVQKPPAASDTTATPPGGESGDHGDDDHNGHDHGDHGNGHDHNHGHNGNKGKGNHG